MAYSNSAERSSARTSSARDLPCKPSPGRSAFAGGILIAILATLPAVGTADATPAHKNARHGIGKHQIEKKDKPAEIVSPGPLHIVVSLANQRVSLYANGALAARSAVSTGTPGHPTPTGVFSVIQKNRHHRSNIYSNAPMPFMQRITWSGIALHAGVLPGYPASHGCIRLTNDFAQLLWKTTKLGVRVIVTHDEVAPVVIAHPLLFASKSPIAKSAAADPIEPAAADPALPVVPVRIAETTLTVTDASGAADGATEGSAAIEPSYFPAILSERNEARKERTLSNNPITVFISRKEKKLFVRQDFQPLFEAPVTIVDEQRPMGTHVFTANLDAQTGTATRWLAISLPSTSPKAERSARVKKISGRRRYQDEPAKPVEVTLPAPSAAEALNRIGLTKDVVARIEELMSPGATLVVSDQGLGEETGEGTDFIVVMR